MSTEERPFHECSRCDGAGWWCGNCDSPGDECGRLPMPAETRDWRPIETAPKDGTDVLLRDSEGEEGAGYWCEDVSSWWWWGHHSDYTCDPVSWMPLPEPPKENSDG